MKTIGVGRQAKVYQDNGLAIKIYNASVPFEIIKYEGEISKKIAQIYNRVPKYYGIYHDNHQYGLRFELIKGELLATCIRKNILHLRKYISILAKTHLEMHEKSIKGLESTVDKFGRGLSKYQGLDKSVQNGLMKFLESSTVESLCHGDMHPYNVMIDEKGEIRVIDWIDAYCGNPLSDVARTYYLLSKGTSSEKNHLFKTIENIIKRILAREYLNSYFSDKQFPEREFNIWSLIIQICRYNEGIEEEKVSLKKSIALGIERLHTYNVNF